MKEKTFSLVLNLTEEKRKADYIFKISIQNEWVYFTILNIN